MLNIKKEIVFFWMTVVVVFLTIVIIFFGSSLLLTNMVSTAYAEEQNTMYGDVLSKERQVVAERVHNAVILHLTDYIKNSPKDKLHPKNKTAMLKHMSDPDFIFNMSSIITLFVMGLSDESIKSVNVNNILPEQDKEVLLYRQLDILDLLVKETFGKSLPEESKPKK